MLTETQSPTMPTLAPLPAGAPPRVHHVRRHALSAERTLAEELTRAYAAGDTVRIRALINVDAYVRDLALYCALIVENPLPCLQTTARMRSSLEALDRHLAALGKLEAHDARRFRGELVAYMVNRNILHHAA